jgi:spermidine/putrescine transport system ATP-binding protein
VAGPAVRLEGVGKRFGAVLAVDRVSLEIEQGAFFALLGPSGCGKTTLLRLIAGFEAPDEGRILIDGEDVAGLPPNRRPVNTVFQSYAVFPHMSVAANVGYGLRMERVPAPERRRRVEEALALVRLEGFGGRRPDQLSGGQRQRVALARALVKRPKVLLLDEPLSALDAKLRGQMRAELAQLQQAVGITFLLVTHDQDEALALAGRCAVMREGQLEQQGAPADLYERPASRFVADFIGEVNLFEGRLQAGGREILCPALPAPLALPSRAGDDGAQAWAAVRPERVELAPGPGGIAGVVRRAAYLGGASLYEVEIAGGRTIKALRPNAGALQRLAPGARVFVSWPPDAVAVLLS